MNENKIKEIIDENLKALAEKSQQNFEDLKNNLAEKFDEIKQSHDEVTDTEKNKYGAYFFRGVELVILALVVYQAFH